MGRQAQLRDHAAAKPLPVSALTGLGHRLERGALGHGRGLVAAAALYGMATDGLRGSETVVSVFAFGFAGTSLLTLQPCCRLASAGHAGPYAEAATGVRVKACAFAFVENALSDGASAASRSLRQPAGRFLPTCRRPLRAMPPCGRRSASVCCCCCRCCPLPSCTLP